MSDKEQGPEPWGMVILGSLLLLFGGGCFPLALGFWDDIGPGELFVKVLIVLIPLITLAVRRAFHLAWREAGARWVGLGHGGRISVGPLRWRIFARGAAGGRRFRPRICPYGSHHLGIRRVAPTRRAWLACLRAALEEGRQPPRRGRLGHA